MHHQQLDAWYRTLDRLRAAKERIEERLYERLRDWFSFQPDLVLYDITRTYFEGAGPAGFAKHGYRNVTLPSSMARIRLLVMAMRCT